MVRRFGVPDADEEDLAEDALLHWCQERERQPGATPAYYLQSCRFFLLNRLRGGRSLDSLRHRHGRCPVAPDGETSAPDLPDQFVTPSTVQVTIAREELGLLASRLGPVENRVLRALLAGCSLREVARDLHVSHTTVCKVRRQIANQALQVGLGPPRRHCQPTIAPAPRPASPPR